MLAGVLLTLFFAWNVAQSVQRAGSELKSSGSSDTLTFKLIHVNGVRALTINYSVFFVTTGLMVKILFMLFSVYNTTVCNGLKMSENDILANEFSTD